MWQLTRGRMVVPGGNLLFLALRATLGMPAFESVSESLHVGYAFEPYAASKAQMSTGTSFG